MKWIFSLACACAWNAWGAPPDLSQFQLDPRLRIELFAAEPDVVDPVALTFDAEGRMYVVEMRDYPYGFGADRKPGGTIRLLEDRDHDGRADRSVLFASGLSFPTSIAPWNGGVLVTAPPDILFLKDNDGDGKADQREVYFTGFVLGVTDSNVNGLRWGLDNRLHGVNGGNGGTIFSPKRPGEKVVLDNADFSVSPKNWEIEKTYQTSGGFGLVFDEFGRSFVTYNINHLLQRIIPLRNLHRFPGMFPLEATRSISDHEDMARIFSISVAQTRPNHPEQAGHFSSAGGLGYIGFDAYPEDLYGSVTVCDVVGNLIHRDVLIPDGPVFRASRSPAERDREFLASRDGACRLIALELSLDGALYAADMQRDVIEHPDYIPEKVLKTQNIRAGDDRGRIYRITPKAGLKSEEVNLAAATPARLVAELENHNQFRRMTAHRLLLEKGDSSILPRLKNVARSSGYPPARVHALWLLHALRGFDESIAARALKDEDPGVRENALRILERWNPSGEAILNASRLERDPSPGVRFQLALTLGAFDEARVRRTLADLLLDHRDSYWIRMAALCSIRSPADIFPVILERLGTNATPVEADLVRDLADLAIGRSEQRASRMIEMLSSLEAHSPVLALAAVEGIDRALARGGATMPRPPVQPVLTRLSTKGPDLFMAAWKLGRRLGLPETAEQRQAIDRARATAIDPDAEPSERIRAIQWLRLGAYTNVRSAIFANLSLNVAPQFQNEAVNTLMEFREPDVAGRIVAHWSALAPALRPRLLNFLLSRRAFHEALVQGIESGTLPLGELNLDLEQRRALLRDSTPEIQRRAAKFISDEEYSNRKAVADEWLKKLPENGEANRGKAVFEKLCAQCHRSGEVGFNVGPDLTSISHRSVEDILFNILDPNMAINPKYTSYQVETNDGDLITGIIEQESPQAITLLQAGAQRASVPRAKITRLKSTGTSLMPEGLEAGLTPSELRDLIAYLQAAGGN